MKLLGDSRPELHEVVELLADLFAGADGGAGFVTLASSLNALDEKASEGDESAEEVIQMVLRFGRLVRLLSAQA